MDKKKLLALIAKKSERKNTLTKQADTCEDVATLRALNSEMDTLNEEIRSLQELADSIPDEKDPDEEEVIERTAAVNGKIPGVVKSNVKAQEQRKEDQTDDKYNTMEYRKAFMEYVMRGTPVPAEYRDDTFTAVADAAAVIPTTIMNEVIKDMKVRGQIFARCRKTNVPGGVRVPILSLKPVATRITEAAPSERQKIQMNTYVSFSYLGLECKVATSLLTSIVSLPLTVLIHSNAKGIVEWSAGGYLI